jgi:hypothetical protein
LERGVIGDIEAPVGAECSVAAIGEVTVGEPQEMPDLLTVRLMFYEPATIEPIG